jgi:alpha-glucosidase
MNSWKADGVVNLPWMHKDVLAEVRKTILLRARLLPYLYTQMWRAARYDEPAVRPLFYGFPDDQMARDIEDAFLLGADLLVAPVLEEGAQGRSVYLPDHFGGWYDFHDGRQFDGGAWIRVAAPLGHLPIFVRAGSMIPVSGQLDGIDGVEVRRELIVFGIPALEGHAELYEDDGETAHWRDDAGLTCCFKLMGHGRSATLAMETKGSFRPIFGAITVRPISRQLQISVIHGEGRLALALGAPWT